MSLRIGFLTTHPIQYQVPVFRVLATTPNVEFTTLYCQIPDSLQQGDGFGIAFQWDLPLLDGYQYQVLTNVSRQPSVTRYNGCDTPGIRDEIRRLQLDALVVNGWVVKSCLQGLRACRQLGLPCLVRGEANLLRPRAWWKRVLHRQRLRSYAACLYIGKANKAFYQKHGVSEDRLFFSPYCVENARFESQASNLAHERDSIRRRWSIGDDAVCFLFSGKLIAKKHPLELLEAFHSIVNDPLRVHLLIVGDGELRSACESRAKELRLPVTFTGFVNQTQIVEAYVAADCLVLPSDHGETWGLVVNEAMACARAAIVSDQVGCAADLVQEGRTGFTFPFGNWPALTAALKRMAASRALAHELGEAARVRIDEYSPANAAQGIITGVRSTLCRVS